MDRLMFLVLLLAMAGHSSGTSWCICKQGLSELVLQKALDYACGAGADCNPIHDKGGCFNPNTVLAHCSFAVNSFFQRKGQASGSCDFAGAAGIITSDPSISGCVYPSSASATPVTTPPNTKTPNPTTTPTPTTTSPMGGTPTTTSPMGGTPTTTSPMGGGSPYVTTPSNGVLGGGVSGLGPSGVGINNDESHAGLTLKETTSISFLSAILMFLGLVFLWA